ncbi:hypothetical protein TDB9533_00516 [Thalassocella blandensis]|nr:hypothetical protein TDB9533_00516 [Thalassocella blandensis]
MKKYIYSIYEKIKIAANNLAIKLEAIRENQDEILAVHKSAETLLKENKKVADSVSKTIENIEEYDLDKIRSIEDVSGLEELKNDLKQTQTLVDEAAKTFKEHKANITSASNSAIETAQKIDATERSLYQLQLLEKDAKNIEEKVQAYIQEEQLEEKDEKAEQIENRNPEAVVQECSNKKVCNFELIEIADKAGRSLAYDVRPQKEEGEEGDNKKKEKRPKTLYVICGEKDGYNEEISIETWGECKSGSECPQIEFSGEGASKKEVKKLSKIELKSKKVIPDKSWADFLRKILVPDMKQLARPAVYNVKVHECDTPDKVPDLKVISFPPAGWKGKAHVKYVEKSDSEKAKIRKENEGKGFLDLKPMGEWDIGGEMECYLDKEEWKASPPKKFLEQVQGCMNRIAPLFSEIGNDYVQVAVNWPSIEFGGHVDLAERQGSYDLSYDADITFKADPFIKVDFDVDIKAIILRVLGQYKLFSDFLNEIIQKAEDGVKLKHIEASAKIEVMLKTTSKIEGDLKWTRKATEGKWSVDASKSTIGGQMGLEVYGGVHVEAKAFFVQAAAGASIAIKSKDGKEKSTLKMFWAALEGVENPQLERQMEFNGLAIHYAAFAELGTDDTKAGQAVAEVVKKSRRGRGDEMDDDEDETESEKIFSAGKKDEMKKLCLLIDAWKSVDASSELGKDEV